MMSRRMNLLVLFALVTAGFSKETPKKALIITVDESKPEESDVIISDLQVEEQSSSPTYRTSVRAYSPNIFHKAPVDKQLGYILLSPEDFKNIQTDNGVTVEKPKYITYPVSAEVYDSSKGDYLPTRGAYSSNPGYPTPVRTKYPSQPAPPLSSFSAHNASQYNNGGSRVPDISSEYTNPEYNPSSRYNKDTVSDGSLRNSPPNYDNKYRYGSYKPFNSYPSSQTFSYGQSQEDNGYHQKPRDIPTPHSSYVETGDFKNSPNPEYYSKSTSSIPYSNDQKEYNPPKSVTYGPRYESKYNYVDQPKSHYKSGPKYPSSSPSYGTLPHSSYESSRGIYDDKPDTYSTAYRDPYPKDTYAPTSSYKEKTYPAHSESYRGSSKPYTYGALSDPYLTKQNSYNSRPSYNTYPNTDSLNDGSLKYRTSPKPYLYDAPKSSYHEEGEPNSYETPTSHNSEPKYPVSAHRSRYITPSYEGYPTSYDSHDPHYHSKPASHTSYDEPTKNFPDTPLPETYGSHYPDTTNKQHLPDSVEKSYHSNPVSSKSPTFYRQSTSPEDLPQYYQSSNRSSYPTYSSDQYGSTPTGHYSYSDPSQPASYNDAEHIKLTPEDATPSSYSNKKSAKTASKNSLSSSSLPYSHAHRDTLDLPDHHSAKKNYKPSRPAPLYDEYEQPRYPPLPPYTKSSAEKTTYNDDYDDHSKERTNSYTSGEDSYPPKSHSSGYVSESYNPTYNKDQHQSYYPASTESSHYYDHDHSSEEAGVNIPKIYTKSVTKSKSYVVSPDESSKESGYAKDYSSEAPYSPRSYSSKDSYKPTNKKTRVYTTGSSTNSSPHSYGEAPRSSDTYAPSKPPHDIKNFKYYTRNDNPGEPASLIRETLPPKRVEGVVYRSRKRYYDLPKIQKPGSYLSYIPKTAPAFDYKAYETAPKKNLTKVIPPKTDFKFKYSPMNAETSYREENLSDSYEDYEDSNLAAIPGEAGKDYPVLKEIPHIRFSCDSKAPGFYADVEHRCQVYHQCSDKGRVQSFLCPNGTIFNQETFVCEWWHNVDCEKSEKHYGKNKDLYKPNVPEKGKVKQSSRQKKKILRNPPYYSDDHQGYEKGRDDDDSTTNKEDGRKRRSKITYA
ncbi:adhesive plaque matrix protein-like [Stegodyphus dumicola]|uniref:adhesive plaque matrix protein-like n=1 Tax=Stegodyphus dumicola TaxID=202533 RepID=UPI0015ACABE8|nr:adhesive plaque matrix protein-like [Stegodyphus dumicola]XP_035214215.1 adhesive plaque matrix protein-like [Stegodyphus dumicola]